MNHRGCPRTEGAKTDGSQEVAQKRNPNGQTVEKTKGETAADEGEAAVDSDQGVEEVEAARRNAEKREGALPAVADRKGELTGGAEEENQAQQTGGVGDPLTAQEGGHTDHQQLMTTRAGELTDRQARGVRSDDLDLEKNTELNRDWQVQEASRRR